MKRLIVALMMLCVFAGGVACTSELGVDMPLDVNEDLSEYPQNNYNFDISLETNEVLSGNFQNNYNHDTPLGMSEDLIGNSQNIYTNCNQYTSEEWGTLYRFKQDGLFGFKDAYENIIIEAQYYGAHPFSEGLAFVIGVEGRNNQTGFIDLAGNLVIPLPLARHAKPFSEGFASIVVRDWDWTYEDPLVTESFGPFIFIDRTGQEVFGYEFEMVSRFSEGFARVTLYRGNIIFINTIGQNAFGMEFELAGDFWGGYANVKLLNGTHTHINREGTVVDIDRIWGRWIWENGVRFPARQGDGS
jgi:hypothetical protein